MGQKSLTWHERGARVSSSFNNKARQQAKGGKQPNMGNHTATLDNVAVTHPQTRTAGLSRCISAVRVQRHGLHAHQGHPSRTAGTRRRPLATHGDPSARLVRPYRACSAFRHVPTGIAASRRRDVSLIGDGKATARVCACATAHPTCRFRTRVSARGSA